MNDLEQELKELEKQEQITQKRGNKGKIKIIDKDEKKSTIAKNVIIIEKENDTTQKKILINDLQINLYNDDCLKKN